MSEKSLVYLTADGTYENTSATLEMKDITGPRTNAISTSYRMLPQLALSFSNGIVTRKVEMGT